MCNFAFCKYLHSYSSSTSSSTNGSNIGSGSNMKWNQIKFALEFRRFRAESSQSAVNRRHCHSASSLSLIFCFPLSLFLSLCLSPPEWTLHKTKSRDENLLYYYYYYWAFMRARWEHRKLQILCIQRNPFNHAPKALLHHPPLPSLLLTLCHYAAQCWRQMDFYNSLRGCISKSNFRFSLKAFSLASSVAGIALSATLQSVHATWLPCWHSQHLSN